MTAPAVLPFDPKHKRVRASEHAVSAVLKAMAENGLHVGKLCIEGGKVEIHVADVDGESAPANHGGPEKW